MEAPPEPFRTRFDEAWGVVRVECAAGATLSLAVARQITATTQAFTPDPPLVLVDVRGLTGHIDRAARKHLLDDLDKLTAMALLVDSALSTMIANIFIRTQRRLLPMMLFTREQDALEWLIARRG